MLLGVKLTNQLKYILFSPFFGKLIIKSSIAEDDFSFSRFSNSDYNKCKYTLK